MDERDKVTTVRVLLEPGNPVSKAAAASLKRAGYTVVFAQEPDPQLTGVSYMQVLVDIAANATIPPDLHQSEPDRKAAHTAALRALQRRRW